MREETTFFKILAVIIALWLLITTIINPVWFAVFAIGVLIAITIFFLILSDEEHHPILHFFSPFICTISFFALIFSATIVSEHLHAMMVLISLIGGFIFPFTMAFFFKEKAYFFIKYLIKRG